MNKPRDIQIATCLNGFILRAECQNVVIEGNHDDLLKLLKGYYDDPQAFENNLLKSAENNQRYKMRRAGGGEVEELRSPEGQVEVEKDTERGY